MRSIGKQINDAGIAYNKMATNGLKTFWTMVPDYLDEIVESYEKEIRAIIKEKDEIHKHEENEDE